MRKPSVVLALGVAIAFSYLNLLVRCDTEFGTSGIGDKYYNALFCDSGWPFVSHHIIVREYPYSTSSKSNETELASIRPIAIVSNLVIGIAIVVGTMSSFRNQSWLNFVIKVMFAILVSVAIAIQLTNFAFSDYSWSNLVNIFGSPFGKTSEFNDSWLNLIVVFLVSFGITSCLFSAITTIYSALLVLMREKNAG